MSKLVATIACFFAGFVAAMNLVGLVETNPNYDHQWWKVGVAVIVAVVAAFIITEKE